MDLLTLRERTPVLPIPENKAEARVAIARDVVEHVVGERFSAESAYFNISFGLIPRYARKSFEAIALAITNKRSKARCGVCAIGAAAVCAIARYDDSSPVDREWVDNQEEASDIDVVWIDDTGFRKVLRRWFSPKQLDLIECAFECEKGNDSGGSTYKARGRAMDFGMMFGDNNERLIAIFQNIVDHSGTFRPSQKLPE